MTTHQRLTAKRVSAVLDAAMFGIDSLHEDDEITEQEYQEALATIRLMHRRFVAGNDGK